ncbi:MAG: hypothetical protein ACYCTL_00370 [Acidimicrobiales bacterium]
MRCDSAAQAIPLVIDPPCSGGFAAGRIQRITGYRVRRHMERCLRCQADLAGYRGMLRVLRQLSMDRPISQPRAVADVIAALREAAAAEAVRAALRKRRIAVAAGLASAVAAVGGAGAAAAVFASKGRSMRHASTGGARWRSHVAEVVSSLEVPELSR